MNNLQEYISKIPPGYSEVIYRDRKYGVSRTDFAGGRSTKIYAEELGGSDYISFNFYRKKNGNLLKTCEMPKEKVQKFIEGFELL